MPRSVLTTVPNLPMFVNDPGPRSPVSILNDVRYKNMYNEAEPITSNYYSQHENWQASAGNGNRRARKGRKKHVSSEKTVHAKTHQIEVPVHSKHHRHKSRSKQRPRVEQGSVENSDHQIVEQEDEGIPEELVTEVEQSSSDVLDSLSHPHSGNISDNPQISSKLNAYVKEIRNLKEENEDLKEKLHSVMNANEENIRHSNFLLSEKAKIDFEKECFKLKKEILELKQKQSHQKDQLEKLHYIENENGKLKETVTMLKNVVSKLNEELKNYQERFVKLGVRANSDIPGKIVKAVEKCRTWDNVNIEAVTPLLEAYTQSISEKNDVIMTYEIEMSKVELQIKDIVGENEKLFTELETLRKKYATLAADHNALNEDLAYLRDENRNFKKQLTTEREKINDVHLSYQQKVLSMKAEVEDSTNQYHQCRIDLLTTKGKHEALRDDYERLKCEIVSMVPYSVHNSSVIECRRLFEELKLKYEADKFQLKSKLQELELANPQLQEQVTLTRVERGQLEAQVCFLEKSLKKIQHKNEWLQSQLVASQISCDCAKKQLRKAIEFAEELVREQETLQKQLHARHEETHTVAQLGSTIVYRMGSFRDKLKNVQKYALKELNEVEKRIRIQQRTIVDMKDDNQREVMRLRNLLQHKEVLIGNLMREKSKTEESLEVVWQAVTRENFDMKESLKQVSMRIGRDFPIDDS